MALYLWTTVAEEKEKKESSEYKCDPEFRPGEDFEWTEALENKYSGSLKLLRNTIIKQ